MRDSSKYLPLAGYVDALLDFAGIPKVFDIVLSY